MAEINNVIAEASQDLQTIEDFVNLPADSEVYPRLLPSVNVGTLAGARQAIFEAGGLPATPFATKALMTASALVDGDYAMVIDGGTDNGLYVKTAGAWVKSGYDPLTQAKTYADTNKADTLLRVQNVFATKALMTESALVDGSNAQVNNDTTADNNGFYKKTAGAWVESKYNPLNSAKLYADKKDEELLQRIVTISPNLFNYRTAMQGALIDEEGNLAISTSSTNPYSVSDFIAVEPSTNYTLSGQTGYNGFNRISYFTQEKEFISREAVSMISSGFKTVLMPDNAEFVRLNMTDGTAEERERMFVKGSVKLPFAYFERRFLSASLHPDTTQEVLDAVDSSSNLAKHFYTSKNLFDYRKVTENRLINVTGEEVPPATEEYYLSDFISIEPNTDYSVYAVDGIPAFIHISFFTEDKEFITRSSIVNQSGGLTTRRSPLNAYYVRLNINQGTPKFGERMFVKGTDRLPFEYGGTELRNAYLDENALKGLDIGASTTPQELGSKIRFDVDINGVFKLEQGWTGYERFKFSTHAEVYAMYDELMSLHPEYITRQNIGVDALGNTMYCYRFTPVRPPAGFPTKFPKIVLQCGLHGDEKVPPLAVYLMMRECCNNWKDSNELEVLRFNVDFVIIPVTNPSGWDAITRENHNLIDLNRNFPFRQEPVLELETKNIVELLDLEEGISAFFDCHNFYKREDYHLWVPLPKKEIPAHRMIQALSGRMTRVWRKEYEWIPQDDNWFAGEGTTSTNPTVGVSANYAREVMKFPIASTFEICQRWEVKVVTTGTATAFDEMHTKTMTEAYVNWMLITLQELERMSALQA